MNRRIENPLFFMKRRLVYYTVLGAVLFIGVGLLSIADWADAAGRDRISFASNRTGNFDIYVMDTNGENLRNLTNHPTDEFGPWAPAGLPVHTWSPDGRFLAYVSGRDGSFKIHVMDTRTGKHRRLTHRREWEWDPAWSPDGKQIAFVSHDNERHDEIYKTDVNGKHLVQLTDFGGNRHPAWSPDGKQIAFISSSHNRGAKKDGLYVMNADGKELRRMPDGEIQAIKGEFGSKCAWSPDGKQIAFRLYIPNAERYHLCVIDADGKNLRQLTQGGPIAGPRAGEKQQPVKEPAFPLPPLPLPSLPEIGSPTWSPDGKQIAYVYSDKVLWQTADIYVIDAEGNGRGTPLVTGARQEFSPRWVPEGFLSVSPQPQLLTTLWAEVKKQQK